MDNPINAIDSFLAGIYDPEAPGAAVIITKGGETFFRKGYGMANLELGVAVSPEMVFRLGSITKQFTAVGILLLEERGLLSVQDDIRKHLPDYPIEEHTITIEHLLNHTSGIKSYTSMPEWLPLIRNDLTLQEIIDIFKDQPMDFAPGERWLYNNSGYILLGAVIEAVSGKSYEAFIQEEIFTPLGMENTLYDDPKRLVPGRASGYQKGEEGFENAAYLSMTQPHAAGALASNVDDLALWYRSLAAGKVLSKSNLELAWQPHTMLDGSDAHYGCGWGIFTFQGKKIVEHGGGINGFVTFGLAVPDEGLYVAMLTNSENPPEDPGWVAFKIAMMALGTPYQEPETVQVEKEVLEGFVGVYQDQADEEGEVYITFGEEHLQMQSKGGRVSKLLPQGDLTFGIEKSLTKIIFERATDSRAAGMRVLARFGPDRYAVLTDKPLPEPPMEVQIEAEALENYAGQYELGPGISLVLRTEEGKLLGRMGGQEEVELFPTSETHFFLKVIDAQVDFEMDSEGQITGLVLHQGGQDISARRVK